MASAKPVTLSSARGYDGLEQLVTEVDKLVSLPNIYYRLEEAIVDPGSTAESIAGLLQSDPNLCARMLRLANSAFYSFPTQIETIDRAVNVIGLRQIRELVLTTSVIQAFERIPSEVVDMSKFWEHSVAVGVMARALGSRIKKTSPDQFYIPGLLHDVGRLVLYLKLPELMVDLLTRRESSAQSMFAMEQELLGYTHAEVGSRLLENWRLPQSIWEPVAIHHNPSGDGDNVLTASAIHVADAWVNTNRAGSTGSCFLLEMNPQAIERIDIALEDLHQMGLEAAEQTQDIVRQFLNH